MSYKSFVNKAIEEDKRNKFEEYSGDRYALGMVPQDLREFYEKYNPVDVEVQMTKFYPVGPRLKNLQSEYSFLEGKFVFATINGDPVFLKGKSVYTCPHGDSDPKHEKIAGSFMEYLDTLVSKEEVKESTETTEIVESKDNPDGLKAEIKDKKPEPKDESPKETTEGKPEEKKEIKKKEDGIDYNVDMNESQAKRTLHVLSATIINQVADKDKKLSQYTANIYANVITKNLLHKWSKGFRRLKIVLSDDKTSSIFEFIPPTMTQDFVSRFVQGRESLNGLIHKNPEIKIKISPKAFHTMKDYDDAYHFFKAAIQYYDSKLVKYGNKLMAEVMKLGHNMKHVIGNSKLSGLVTYPLSLLFVFDNVDMNSKDTFNISDSDVQTINKFVRNISSRYAAPEKEKRQIIEDVKEMVKTLREYCEMTETMRDLYYLPEAVEKFLFNGYEDLILEASKIFLDEQIDWGYKPESAEAKVIYEMFGPKRLKKIPRDLITYITVESDSINDGNDKMMLASYTTGKIELCEWMIELIHSNSKKYIVPHDLRYLESIRTQLLACYKKIMDVKIVNPRDRAVISVKYPVGYEF